MVLHSFAQDADVFESASMRHAPNITYYSCHSLTLWLLICCDRLVGVQKVGRLQWILLQPMMLLLLMA
jgi:hypothetical protein